jgi:hypothetical protein
MNFDNTDGWKYIGDKKPIKKERLEEILIAVLSEKKLNITCNEASYLLSKCNRGMNLYKMTIVD